MNRNWKKIAAILILPVMLFGCSMAVDTEVAEFAVSEFQESYNKESYDVIHENAHPEFKNFISQKKLNLLLKKLNSHMGKHITSNLISWKAKTGIREGTSITLNYDVTYENDDKARVTFIYKVNDGMARLYNFNVASEALNRSKNTDI
ncbi:MAG: hypothetical protein L3J58_01095 [Emcibacter sp.]|nr:hypothetical protein [Emcibacter sp.]